MISETPASRLKREGPRKAAPKIELQSIRFAFRTIPYQNVLAWLFTGKQRGVERHRQEGRVQPHRDVRLGAILAELTIESRAGQVSITSFGPDGGYIVGTLED